jgi:hypothetical protein
VSSVQGTPVAPEESQAVQQTFTHIGARCARAAAFRQSLTPASGSPLSADIVAGHGQDLVTHAMTWMLSADGHLLTLAAAFSTGDLYANGPYSLLRGAAEPLAQVAWLFDDKVSSITRHQRLLGERRDNQLELGKLKAFSKRAEARIQHITDLATKAGFKPAPRPDATGLFRRLLKQVDADPAKDPLGEVLYRVSSGHLHSFMWAAFMGQAEIVAKAREGESGLALIELDLYLFLKLLDPVLRMYDVAQEHWCRMNGVDGAAWSDELAELPPSGKLGIEFRRPGSLAEMLNL